MADNDEIVLEDAKEIAFSLDKAYRRAVRNSDLDRMAELRPKVDDAFDQYSIARLKLFEEGVIATDQDIIELRLIRADIDQAAATQTLIEGAVRFVAFLAARFV